MAVAVAVAVSLVALAEKPSSTLRALSCAMYWPGVACHHTWVRLLIAHAAVVPDLFAFVPPANAVYFGIALDG